MSKSVKMLINEYLGSGYSADQLEKEMTGWHFSNEEEHKDAISYLYEEATNYGEKLSRSEKRILKRKNKK